MMRLAAGIAMVAACATQPPPACDASYVLSPGASVDVAPAAIDDTGITMCLHVDGAAHFTAATDALPGLASPFGAELRDGAGTLSDGHDATFRSEPPLSSTVLEWTAVPGDVVLHVYALEAPATTALSLVLAP